MGDKRRKKLAEMRLVCVSDRDNPEGGVWFVYDLSKRTSRRFRNRKEAVAFLKRMRGRGE